MTKPTKLVCLSVLRRQILGYWKMPTYCCVRKPPLRVPSGPLDTVVKYVRMVGILWMGCTDVNLGVKLWENTFLDHFKASG